MTHRKLTKKQEEELKKARAMTQSWDDFMQEELADPKRAEMYLAISIEEYLEDGDMDTFLSSLRHLAKARGGMARIAKKTGLSRESLYRTLSRRGNPQFRTMLNVIHALGMRVRIESIPAK
jgi:probable addiction module antidote protein